MEILKSAWAQLVLLSFVSNLYTCRPFQRNSFMITVDWSLLRLLWMNYGWKIKWQPFESARAKTVSFNTRQGRDVLGLLISFIQNQFLWFHQGKQCENSVSVLCSLLNILPPQPQAQPYCLGILNARTARCFLAQFILAQFILAQFTSVESSDWLGHQKDKRDDGAEILFQSFLCDIKLSACLIDKTACGGNANNDAFMTSLFVVALKTQKNNWWISPTWNYPKNLPGCHPLSLMPSSHKTSLSC